MLQRSMPGVANISLTFDWKTEFNGKRYRRYGSYLKKRFGSKVFKVIVGRWTGPILLQDHGDEVHFRNLQIRRL